MKLQGCHEAVFIWNGWADFVAVEALGSSAVIQMFKSRIIHFILLLLLWHVMLSSPKKGLIFPLSVVIYHTAHSCLFVFFSFHGSAWKPLITTEDVSICGDVLYQAQASTTPVLYQVGTYAQDVQPHVIFTGSLCSYLASGYFSVMSPCWWRRGCI